jgi:predicted DNA-binding transcriptional regulator AlpA
MALLLSSHHTVEYEKTMDVPQPLLELGYDPAMTARLFEVFKDTLEASIKKTLADFPTLAASPGIALEATDKLKAADLRIALLLGKIPEDAGLLIDTKTFARLLSISSRTLSRLIDLKAVPQAVHLGRLIRWRLSEVLEWLSSSTRRTTASSTSATSTARWTAALRHGKVSQSLNGPGTATTKWTQRKAEVGPS